MTDKKFIPALTGIRAIVVYCLFFYHVNPFDIYAHPALYAFVNQFYVFVTFFFVLSGFIIYHKYNSISSLNKKSIYNYLVNRFARIFPILFILVTITFFLAYYHGYNSGPEAVKLYLLNISFIKGLSSTYYLTGIGPSWSLSIEELFYLLAPFLFFYATGLSKLLKLLMLFYAIGITLTFICSFFYTDGFFGSYIFTAAYTFFGRFFEFACGIFLAFIVHGKYPKLVTRRLQQLSLYIGLLWVLASVTALYLIAGYYSVEHAMDTWPGVFVNNIVIAPGIAILFYSLVYQQSLLQKLLSSRLLVQLGNSTYSFYLLHTTFVLSYIFKFIGKDVFIAFFAMVVVSYIFYRLVEQPCARFVKKMLHRD